MILPFVLGSPEEVQYILAIDFYRYKELKECYRTSLEEIRARDVLLQKCQRLVAGKSMRFVV